MSRTPALDAALAELEQQAIRMRIWLDAASRNRLLKPPMTIERILTKLHAAGVSIQINGTKI